MRYIIERASCSMIYTPSSKFQKERYRFSSNIKFCPSNFTGCNVGIADVRIYDIEIGSCHGMHTNFHTDWFWNSKVVRSEYTYRHTAK